MIQSFIRTVVVLVGSERRHSFPAPWCSIRVVLRTTGLVVLFNSLLALAVAQAAAPPSHVQQTVVLVARRNPQGQRLPVGTAFHIGGGLFRTAAHVALSQIPPEEEGKGYDDWALYRADEFGNPADMLGRSVVACSDKRWTKSPFGYVLPHDSALLRLVDGPVPSTGLPTTGRPKAGDAFSTWGFPRGGILFESKGRIIRVTDEWVTLREQAGAPTLGGHSGSPVLDNAGGVIGILVAGVTGVAEWSWAVSIWDAESACPAQ